MGVFKKKAPREIKDDDPLFVKLWYNERSHAFIVLGLYFIFFLVLILIVSFTGRKPSNNSVTGSSTKGLFDDLSSKQISYNYVIKEGNKTYYFSGVNKNDGIYGTILFNGDSSSINIVKDECFAGVYENEEFVSQDSLCPENIKYYLFNPGSIYKLIEDEKGIKNDAEKYYLFSPKDNEKIKIYYNNKAISKITINSGNSYSYELDFNIEKVEEE